MFSKFQEPPLTRNIQHNILNPTQVLDKSSTINNSTYIDIARYLTCGIAASHGGHTDMLFRMESLQMLPLYKPLSLSAMQVVFFTWQKHMGSIIISRIRRDVSMSSSTLMSISWTYIYLWSHWVTLSLSSNRLIFFFSIINKALNYPFTYQVTLINLLKIYLDIVTNPIDDKVDHTSSQRSLTPDHPFDIIYKSRASFTIYLLQFILLLCVPLIVFCP